MREQYTAGARRTMSRMSARAQARGATMAEPGDLLAAFADESESKAGELLFGQPGNNRLTPTQLLEALGVPLEIPFKESGSDRDFESTLMPFSLDLRTILNDARSIAKQWDRSVSVGTEHLLAGFLSFPGPWLDWLAERQFPVTQIQDAVAKTIHDEIGPLSIDEEAPVLELAEPGEDLDLARIFDASANRAREGLRVVEDYARFALNDPMLTKRLKTIRHRLTSALRSFDPDDLLGGRDTPGDVGTHIMTVEEQSRENPRAVLAANFKRVAEALRSMEEFAKLKDIWLAGQFEVLRYDIYTVEKMTATALSARKTLGDAKLYVLVGGVANLNEFTWIVGEALEGGANVIQLRDKQLSDRELLQFAREARILTASAKARFIMNDRPDLAKLAGADGVHLGQTDLKVRDARKIVGARTQIGVSTHNPDQVRQSVLDSANYFAVGPVFASSTKEFQHDEIAGLSLLQYAAENSSLPWFAIGGIHERNLDQVLEAGASRIAVSASVVKAPSPRKAARALRDRLDAEKH